MVRVRKLAYVELNVTDLARSRRFYEAVVGLQFVEQGAKGELRFRCSDDHHSVVLHESPHAGLKRSGFFLEDEAQFAPLAARTLGIGVRQQIIHHFRRQVLLVHWAQKLENHFPSSRMCCDAKQVRV